nr:hypothetical protein [Maliibacterium massiliense]
MKRGTQKAAPSMGIGVGSVSILAIFVVLCLTAFAALSLVSARADVKLARKSADAGAAYYAAEAQAETRLAALLAEMDAAPDWRGVLQGADMEYTVMGGALRVSYALPIGAGKTLQAAYTLPLDGAGRPTGAVAARSYQVQVQPRQAPADPLQGL